VPLGVLGRPVIVVVHGLHPEVGLKTGSYTCFDRVDAMRSDTHRQFGVADNLHGLGENVDSTLGHIIVSRFTLDVAGTGSISGWVCRVIAPHFSVGKIEKRNGDKKSKKEKRGGARQGFSPLYGLPNMAHFIALAFTFLL